MGESSNKVCIEIEARLADYSVGAVSPGQRRTIEQHLASCSSCARELAALARTAELVERVGLEEAPDSWNEIRARLEPRPARSSTGGFLWWLARHKLQSAAAASAVFIAIGAMLLTSMQSPPEISPDTYFANHATMRWSEPFSDKAAIGLVSSMASEQEASL